MTTYQHPKNLSQFRETVADIVEYESCSFMSHTGGYEARLPNDARCLYIRGRTEHPWNYNMGGYSRSYSYGATLPEAVAKQQELKRELKLDDDAPIYPQCWQ